MDKSSKKLSFKKNLVRIIILYLMIIVIVYYFWLGYFSVSFASDILIIIHGVLVWSSITSFFIMLIPIFCEVSTIFNIGRYTLKLTITLSALIVLLTFLYVYTH